MLDSSFGPPFKNSGRAVADGTPHPMEAAVSDSAKRTGATDGKGGQKRRSADGLQSRSLAGQELSDAVLSQLPPRRSFSIPAKAPALVAEDALVEAALVVPLCLCIRDALVEALLAERGRNDAGADLLAGDRATARVLERPLLNRYGSASAKQQYGRKREDFNHGETLRLFSPG
jgi:hypothetical protein